MKRGIFFTSIALAVIGLTRLIFNSVALRFFGEEKTGALNVAMSLAVLALLPASTGIGSAVLRFVSKARGQGQHVAAAWVYRQLLKASLLMALLGAALMYLFRYEIALSRQLSVSVVSHAIVLTVAYILYLYFRSVFYAVDRLRLYVIIEFCCGLLFFGALALFTFLRWSEWLVSSFTVAYFIFSLWSFFSLRDYWDRGGSGGVLPSWRELLSYSSLSFVGVTAALAVRELAVIVAPDIGTLPDAAHLALCMSVLAPLQFLPRSMRMVLFAHSAELEGRGEHEELRRNVSAANHWLLFFTLPACGFLAITAQPLLTLAGANLDGERLSVFYFLLAAAFAEVISTPANNTLQGTGDVAVTVYASLVALLGAFALWFFAGPTWGMRAVAAGLLLNALIKGGWPMWIVKRRMQVSLTRNPRTLLYLFVLSALLFVASRATGAVWPCALLYVFVTLALLRPQLREFFSAAGRA